MNNNHTNDEFPTEDFLREMNNRQDNEFPTPNFLHEMNDVRSFIQEATQYTSEVIQLLNDTGNYQTLTRALNVAIDLRHRMNGIMETLDDAANAHEICRRQVTRVVQRQYWTNNEVEFRIGDTVRNMARRPGEPEFGQILNFENNLYTISAGFGFQNMRKQRQDIQFVSRFSI